MGTLVWLGIFVAVCLGVWGLRKASAAAAPVANKHYLWDRIFMLGAAVVCGALMAGCFSVAAWCESGFFQAVWVVGGLFCLLGTGIGIHGIFESSEKIRQRERDPDND